MLDLNWNPSDGFCPFACKKYRVARANCEVACETLGLMHEQRKKLEPYIEQMHSICQVADEGFQILGVEEKGGATFVVLMRKPSSQKNSVRDVYLFALPYRYRADWICHMSLRYLKGGEAYIIDWHSRIENSGYGSILMKHLISFLASADFSSITGFISPVDFDHEKKLRHFYTKFGFTIRDFPDKRELFLSLKK